MLIPALNYAERDRIEERLMPHEEAAVTDTTRELLDAVVRVAVSSPANASRRCACSATPCNGSPDELALRMLGQLVHGLPITLDITREPQMSSDLVALVRAKQYGVVALADLPPSAPTKSRYLVKKLRAAFPDLRIIVGRWANADLADETLDPLTEAGASHVARTLLETRRYLADAVGVVDEPVSAASTSDAA